MGRAQLNKKDIYRWSKARIELLQDICNLFEKYNVKYWVDAGTLLGLVRDGEIIHEDSDHDFCIKIEDIDDNFFQMIDEINSDPKWDKVSDVISKKLRKEVEEGKVNLLKTMHRIQYKKEFISGIHTKRIYSDLLILFPFDDFYFYKQNNEYVWRYKTEHIKEFKTIDKYNCNIRIPKYVEDYLDIEFNYGWRFAQKFNAYKTNFWHRWENYKNELPQDYNYVKE